MSFIVRIRTGVITAVASLLAVTSALTVDLSAAAANTPTPPCGTVTYYKTNRAPWVCSFADDFSGTSLNTRKWTAFQSIPGGFHGGDECYMPSRVGVSNGSAKIRVTKDVAAFDCAGRTAHYRSGMISTRDTFSQAYGRFEIRAIIPTELGLQDAFWLLPKTPYRADGMHYGEIDVMESWGAHPDWASPHLHYVQTPGTPNLGAYCHVQDMATTFHTYTLTWTPTSMTFGYDGKSCWRTSWTPIPQYQPLGAKAPEPFNQPFYMIINVGVGSQSYSPGNVPNAATWKPATMQIDYVRVWK